MPRTQKKTTAPETLPARAIPCPSTAARPRGFRRAEIVPAQRPDDTPIEMYGWISPDGAIAVQYATSWRPGEATADHRYVVSTIVNGRAWVITLDTRHAGGLLRYHTASTIRALAGAIAARVAADPGPWQALQKKPSDPRHSVPPRAVAAFRRQIADLIDR